MYFFSKKIRYLREHINTLCQINDTLQIKNNELNKQIYDLKQQQIKDLVDHYNEPVKTIKKLFDDNVEKCAMDLYDLIRYIVEQNGNLVFTFEKDDFIKLGVQFRLSESERTHFLNTPIYYKHIYDELKRILKKDDIELRIFEAQDEHYFWEIEPVKDNGSLISN
jgi:hypothetical protein